jgi:hypothetical protein
MSTFLKIPKHDRSGNIDLNMDSIYVAERRIDEIAIANTHKAPELAACFTKAFSLLVDHLAVISKEKVKAENAVGIAKAIVVLDRAPEVLKAKGLVSAKNPAGSEDLRNSVLLLDVDYQQALETYQELEAYYQLIKNKKDTIDKAYMAVRKLMGEIERLDNSHTAFGANELSNLEDENMSDIRKKIMRGL